MLDLFQTTYGDGFKVLLDILQVPGKLLPAALEAVLRPLAKAAEFWSEEAATSFVQVCKGVLAYLAEKFEKEMDSAHDKTQDSAFAAHSSTLKHLQTIMSCSLPLEEAERLVSAVQRRMVERMLGFLSFNKQLSAVREINKLLENGRAVASKDEGLSVRITIQWLEKNDILRKILRSHLHHKQYVDQLSEEHLDAIWAATEKPDQFEVVKNNIFDLLADLAWSFSDAQLDSLFSRFEKTQGRTPADIVKILQLVKKLAESDTKGVMATRLLELLWSLMHSGEATAEVLESGAFTEILAHYDSISCASKDVFIKRCMDTVASGQAVIPSLRLLRDIIMPESEKASYQSDPSQLSRLQLLNKEHALLDMVVSSLEAYMRVARTLPAELLTSVGGDKGSAPMVDGCYTHQEHLEERLSFLLWACQVGEIQLPWPVAERVWREVIGNPACPADQERGLQWLCTASDKVPLLDPVAQANILGQKLTKMDPKLYKPHSDDLNMTTDMDLEGLPFLWQIALQAESEDIVAESINLLKDVHTCLAENLQASVLSIRQQFVDECMRRLMTAVEAGGMRTSSEATTDSCSMADSGGDGGGSDKDYSDQEKDAERQTEKRARLRDGGAGNGGGASAAAVAAGQASWLPTKQGKHQVERCLRLLMVFITKCEGRCPRKVPPHGASFQGRPLHLQVTHNIKEPFRLSVDVHANEYLFSLRSKVAKLMDAPASRIRLIVGGRELTQDWQVVRQCGLQDHSTLGVSVSLVDRVVEAFDEQRLPGILISQQKEVYDVLFRLLEVNSTSIREAVHNLLMLLPTHPGILADFLSIYEARTTEEAHATLQRHFSSRARLLYTLQVLEGILMPVNKAPTPQNLEFRADFLRCGGFQLLLGVFQPKALPDGVDDRTRRGCYSNALCIIKFLLTGKGEEVTIIDADADADSPTSMPIIRADFSVGMESSREDEVEDVVVSMSEAANGSIEANMQEDTPNVQKLRIQKVLEPAEPIDLDHVMAVATNLAWATGLGHIEAMGGSLSLPEFSKALRESRQKNLSKKRPALSGDQEEEGFDSQDVYLCQESLFILQHCLLKRKAVLGAYCSAPQTALFLEDMVIHCPELLIRLRSAELFLKLSRERVGPEEEEPPAHKHILAILMKAKGAADSEPCQCGYFWELLGKLVEDLPYSLEDEELAASQLDEEHAWLESATPVTDDSNQLVKECLFPEILTFLENDDGPEDGGGLGVGAVPVVSPNMQFGVLKGPVEEEGLLQAKCGTPRTRHEAFSLLLILVYHSLESLRTLVSMLTCLHFREEWIAEWEYLPSYGRKPVDGYVGLKNAGATCYMNSVFQQLYMQPQVRKSVLACAECDDKEKQNSVFYQVQSMFGALLGSSLDHYVPEGFWLAYRDYDGMPINLREHQDAFEFFTRLYDSVEETLKSIHYTPTLANIFGGTFAQQREEPFAAISVDVKNKRDLLESLESFVRGDLLEADNAYYCEQCKTKVDALKRACVKSLPHTLVVHLKRFDFDYETMQRLKLKDHFEFPLQLNMKPFTVEGLALRERLQATSPRGQLGSRNLSLSTTTDEDNGTGAGGSSSNLAAAAAQGGPTAAAAHAGAGGDEALSRAHNGISSMDAAGPGSGEVAGAQTGTGAGGGGSRVEAGGHVEGARVDKNGAAAPAPGASAQAQASEGVEEVLDISVREDAYYEYSLVGVVVHSGTAFAGHYYAYIKERDEARGGAAGPESGGWMAFDDKRVEPYDIKDLEKDCFGGKYSMDVYDSMSKMSTPQEYDRPNSAYMLFYERTVPQSSLLAESAGPVSTLASGPAFLVLSSVAAAPSEEKDAVMADITPQDLKFVHESHLLDKQYFKFLSELVDQNTALAARQLVHLNSESRSGSGSVVRVESGSDSPRLSEREITELIKLTVELTLELLCRVYLRAHASLREDMLVWKGVVFKLLGVSHQACKFFQARLVSQPRWLVQFLLKCPVEDVRQMFAQIVVHSLSCSVNFLGGKSLFYESANGRPQDVLFVDAFVETLLNLLPEAANSSSYPCQFFWVILEYARLGPIQRLSLIQRRVIQQWVSYMLKVAMSAFVHKVDLPILLSLMSLLVRSCDTSKFQVAAERMVLEDGADEEPPSVTPGGAVSNPWALGTPLAKLPDEVMEVLKKPHFLRILVESCPDHVEVIRMCEFLSWQCEAFSGNVLLEVVMALTRASGPLEARPLLLLLGRLLEIQDVLTGAFRAPSMFDMLMSRSCSAPKRYVMIKFVAKLALSQHHVRRLVFSQKDKWRQLIDWVAEEIQRHGRDHIGTASSNEDIGGNALLRTQSLEATLKACRSLIAAPAREL
eukprot:jgi/Mesen1/7402/ME000388S06619